VLGVAESRNMFSPRRAPASRRHYPVCGAAKDGKLGFLLREGIGKKMVPGTFFQKFEP